MDSPGLINEDPGDAFRRSGRARGPAVAIVFVIRRRDVARRISMHLQVTTERRAGAGISRVSSPGCVMYMYVDACASSIVRQTALGFPFRKESRPFLPNSSAQGCSKQL